MTFEGYWVVLSKGNTNKPILETLSRSAADARRKFCAYAVSMGWGHYTWNHWTTQDYSVWPVNAGSVAPSEVS